MMTPLSITAHVQGEMSLPQGFLALDALLAAAVAVRDEYPPIEVERRYPEIPVQRSACGRYHLASLFLPLGWEQWQTQYTNRRPVLEQAHTPLASIKFRTLNLATGANKAYRIPRPVGWLTSGAFTAYCLGAEGEVTELLSLVTHLGRRRGVGLGRVTRWEVARIVPWAGFPCVKDGQPLRPLPPETQGLHEAAPTSYTRLTYPYWEGAYEVLACPEVSYG